MRWRGSGSRGGGRDAKLIVFCSRLFFFSLAREAADGEQACRVVGWRKKKGKLGGRLVKRRGEGRGERGEEGRWLANATATAGGRGAHSGRARRSSGEHERTNEQTAKAPAAIAATESGGRWGKAPGWAKFCDRKSAPPRSDRGGSWCAHNTRTLFTRRWLLSGPRTSLFYM